MATIEDKVFDRLFKEAEIAKVTPEELREYEDSLKAYRDIKNSIDSARREGIVCQKYFVQNSCKLSFMHCITIGKGMGSFHRIFFRKDFHRMFLVGSDENFSVNSIRDSL